MKNRIQVEISWNKVMQFTNYFPYNHRSWAVLAILGELPRIKKRIYDPARQASRTYRITWNLLSIQIVAMTSKFPGRPTTSMTAWTAARTCEKTMIANCYNVMMLLINSQLIPSKSNLMSRWCFRLQVAKTEFLLTISLRYQAEKR